jgi:hypothetical protein
MKIYPKVFEKEYAKYIENGWDDSFLAIQVYASDQVSVWGFVVQSGHTEFKIGDSVDIDTQLDGAKGEFMVEGIRFFVTDLDARDFEIVDDECWITAKVCDELVIPAKPKKFKKKKSKNQDMDCIKLSHKFDNALLDNPEFMKDHAMILINRAKLNSTIKGYCKGDDDLEHRFYSGLYMFRDGDMKDQKRKIRCAEYYGLNQVHFNSVVASATRLGLMKGKKEI